MRIPGYCTSCRRFRSRVKVSAADLPVAMTGIVVQGLCEECEQLLETERKHSPVPPTKGARP